MSEMENRFANFLLRFSRRRYCICLFFVAFLLRFAVVLGVRDIHTFHGPSPAGADAVELNSIALNVAAGNGYAVIPGHPTSYRAPGFPLSLAVLYRMSYANYALVYLALCLTGALTCLLTYELARQLVSEGVARAAGLLAAVYLPHIYFPRCSLSEIVFALCVALALWLFLLQLRNYSPLLLAGAGVAIGYAALTRPIAVLFIPLLGLRAGACGV